MKNLMHELKRTDLTVGETNGKVGRLFRWNQYLIPVGVCLLGVTATAGLAWMLWVTKSVAKNNEARDQGMRWSREMDDERHEKLVKAIGEMSAEIMLWHHQDVEKRTWEAERDWVGTQSHVNRRLNALETTQHSHGENNQ